MAVTTQAQQILMQAGPDGDIPDAFWEIVEKYRSGLVNQALAITGNQADAEDVAQETFCKAFRHHEKLSEVRSLGAWLRNINKANAIDRVRKKQADQDRERKIEEQSPNRRGSVTGGFGRLEMREQVAKCVDRLPGKLRTVVVLRHLEGLSYEEIATRMDITEGSVGWLLCEANLRLHEKLKAFFSPMPSSTPVDPTKENCATPGGR